MKITEAENHEQLKEGVAKFLGYSIKLIYLDDIIKNGFVEKVFEKDGSYSTYGSQGTGYRLIVEAKDVDFINNVCKYAGCNFKGGISREEIELIELERKKKEIEKQNIEDFNQAIADGAKNIEALRENIMKLVKNIGDTHHLEGAYSLGRDQQRKLWKILSGAELETSLSRVLRKLKIKISYGEKDPKTNWSTLYVYEDGYEENESKFANYVKGVINNYKNWQYIDTISDLMKLKFVKYYIYGIEVDNRLIYIGKTVRGLRDRILEHLTADFNLNKPLYEMFEKEDFRIVILCEAEGYAQNDLELQMIEKQLIEYYKPECNVQGVKTKYSYR